GIGQQALAMLLVHHDEIEPGEGQDLGIVRRIAHRPGAERLLAGLEPRLQGVRHLPVIPNLREDRDFIARTLAVKAFRYFLYGMPTGRLFHTEFASIRWPGPVCPIVRPIA